MSKNKTQREQEIDALGEQVHSYARQIDELTQEPVDQKKINGLIGVRRSLGQLHDESKRLRAPAVRTKIEEQQVRVRNALGLLPSR